MSDTKQVALRLETPFHDRIKNLAARESRSLHSQIVYILQAWFDRDALLRRLSELDRRTVD